MTERLTSAAVLLRPEAADDRLMSPSASVKDPLALEHRQGGVVVGTLAGLIGGGNTPLVTYPGQPVTRALEARSTVHLKSANIGHDLLLAFDGGDPYLPIVIGCVLPSDSGPSLEAPGQIELNADGDELVVFAQRQLTLRCGSASITLTRDGKILVQGTYVSHRSSGVLRLKAGAVQIN